jgi:hypothetical protein
MAQIDKFINSLFVIQEALFNYVIGCIGPKLEHQMLPARASGRVG